MDAIIYTSAGGHTRNYAHMISLASGLPVYSLGDSEAPEGGDILFLGWIFAGGVKGYKKASKKFRVRGLCGVGMSPPGEKVMEDIRKKDRPPADLPLFYLWGGFELDKLKGINRLIMFLKAKQIAAAMKKIEQPTQEQRQLLIMATTGASQVKKESITPILKWLEQQGVATLGKERHV